MIRQHGQLPHTLPGNRKRIGETETGVVYEQAVTIQDASGKSLKLRRITVVLHEATHDGERKSTAPSISGQALATLPANYRH